MSDDRDVAAAALRVAGVPPAPAGETARGDKSAPKSFAELDLGTRRAICRRCGKPGTHRFAISVNDQSGETKSGNGPAVAHRSWRLCEPCAVEVFQTISKSLR